MTPSSSGQSSERLGRYHLSDCLGGGPTGEVFRAKVYGVAGMDREYAVKRFHASFINLAGAASRLAAAASKYGALEHPRIAKLYEFGEASGQTFTATEYVAGLDLGQLLEHGRLKLGTATQLVVQAARALAYAHGKGFAHVGLSPSNLICSAQGEIKVTDFGILAPRLPVRPGQDPQLRQRLCYLAPEQLEGQNTSAATDVYQLGLIAYELMAGHKPFSADSPSALIEQILAGSLQDSTLAKPYDNVLKRALARSPFERFPDAGALGDALEGALRTSPAPGTAADVGNVVRASLELLREHREGLSSGSIAFPQSMLTVPAKESARASVGKNNSEAKVLDPELGEAPMARPVTSVLEPVSEKGDSAEEDDESWQDIDTRAGNVLAVVGAGSVGTKTADEFAPNPTRQISVALQKGLLANLASAPAVTLAESASPPVIPKEEGLSLEFGPAGSDDEASAQDFLGGEVSVYSLADDLAQAPTQTVLDAADGQKGGVTQDLKESQETPADPLAEVSTDRNLPPVVPPDFSGTSAEDATIPDGVREGTDVALGEGTDVALGEGTDVALGVREESVSQSSLDVAKATVLSRSDDASKKPGKPLMPRLVVGGLAAAVLLVAYQFVAQTVVSSPPQASTAIRHVGLQETQRSTESRGPGEVTPGEVTPSEVTPGEVTPGEVTPSEVTPGEVPPSEVPPSEVTPGEVTPGEVTPGEVTPGAVTPPPTIPSLTNDSSGKEASDRLIITSAPSGAKVYLDGTMVGTTPVDLEGSEDSHRLAVLLPGYDLYTGTINGSESRALSLKEVTPPGGPAGIKVRCRKTNRYYVYVDDAPVGELCPSERIGVSIGKHVVEIYDPLTDSRRAFSVDVVDTRLSVRVKVD